MTGPRLLLLKSHISGYTRKDGTFVAAHEDKRAKHADLKPEHLYSKLSGAEDNGGRAAVHGLANEIIHHRPDLEQHVRREAADLGHSLPDGLKSDTKTNVDAGKKSVEQPKEKPSGHHAAAEQIFDLIKKNPKAKFGLRVVAPDYDEYDALKAGSSLPNSKRWEDGDYTDVELPGTSTASIKENTVDGVLHAIKLLGAHGKNGPNGYYYGDKVALVTGNSVKKRGQDVGERILSDAKVVGVWRKPDTGLSEVQPNGSEGVIAKSILIITRKVRL